MSLDPCALLSPEVLAPIGTFEPGKAPEITSTTKSCKWDDHGEGASDASIIVGVGIRMDAGIAQMRDVGAGKVSGNVNGRPAVRVQSKGAACILGLAVGEGSRVDLEVVAGDASQACEIASKVADIVEPKLPKG